MPKKIIIAVDFDGTITKEDYNSEQCGEINDNCVETIKYLYNLGHTLILNTCRTRVAFANAIEFLKQNDIHKYFTTFNENLPEKISMYRDDCRKISADMYIDDKNLGGFPGWSFVYKRFYELNKEESYI